MELLNTFRYSPENLSRIYGVNFSVIDQAGNLQRMTYKVKIVYCGRFQDDFHLLQVYKFDLYINESLPDEHTYRLANECMNIFYPVNLIMNKYGQIESIQSDELYPRWKELKPSILKQFSGDAANVYIQKTESVMQDENCVQKWIDKEFFFNAFFKLFYWNKQSSIDSQTRLPLIPFKESLAFSCNQTVKLQESKNLIVVREGSLKDEKTMGMLYPRLCHSIHDVKERINGEFKFEYQLDKYNLIDTLHGDAKLVAKGFLREWHMNVHYLEEYKVHPQTLPKMEELNKNIHHKNSFSERIKNFFS